MANVGIEVVEQALTTKKWFFVGTGTNYKACAEMILKRSQRHRWMTPMQQKHVLGEIIAYLKKLYDSKQIFWERHNGGSRGHKLGLVRAKPEKIARAQEKKNRLGGYTVTSTPYHRVPNPRFKVAVLS